MGLFKTFLISFLYTFACAVPIACNVQTLVRTTKGGGRVEMEWVEGRKVTDYWGKTIYCVTSVWHGLLPGYVMDVRNAGMSEHSYQQRGKSTYWHKETFHVYVI